MKIKSIRDIKDLAGKKVLLRADFNVPIEKGEVKEDYKIRASLPTLKWLLKKRCRVAVATHLGDPAGKRIKKLSVAPIGKKLAELAGVKVRFVPDCIGPRVGAAIAGNRAGEVILLENLRYHPGEENNSKIFAADLAEPFDLVVIDAFAVCHRQHASVSAVKRRLPAYAGLLLETELKNLGRALAPVDPLTVVIGGAKISTKLPLIASFLKRADQILLGGAIANDFLKGLGFEIGRSVAGKDLRLSKKLVKIYRRAGNKKILLPIDFVVSEKRDGSGRAALRSVNGVGKNDVILDIGPKTVGFYTRFLKRAKTIVWNGPMGYYENERFKHGTLAIARLVAARSSGKAFGVVGGGETVDALKATKMIEYVDWVSTGGGAMLEYLSGKPMPGLKGIVS